MKLPDPKKLAYAIAGTGMTNEDKQNILDSLPYLSDKKINKLYKSLKKLQKEEEKFIKQVERIDLKYKIKVEEEIKKAKKKAPSA